MAEINNARLEGRYILNDARSVEFWRNNGESAFQNSTQLMDFYPYLFQKVLNDELKGYFSNGELWYLFDMQNGATLSSNKKIFGQQMICAGIEDADKYEYLGEKWKVDINIFKKKINDLSIMQLYVLFDWIQICWRCNNNKDSQWNIEKNIKSYGYE